MMRKLLLLALAVPVMGFAQFVENFDAGLSIPAGWTVINQGSDGTWQIVDFTGGNIGAHSGTNTVSIGYDSWDPHDDYLITPAITVTAGVSDYFSFWARSRDPLYPETISLLVSTTGTSAADFTIELDSEIAPESGPEFYQYSFDLSDYVGQTIYIAFRSQTYDLFYFDIDTVESTGIPTCFAPTGFAASGATTESVNLAWTSAAPEFEIEYGPTGFTQGSGTIVSMDAPGVLSGLDPSTSYQIYLRAICEGNDPSAWVGPISFSTACLAITSFPYHQGFEGGEFPACWENEAVVGTDLWVITNSNQNGTITPRTGNGMAQFQTDDIGAQAGLISPMFDLTGVESPQLTFYYANVNWVGDVDELAVFYRSSEDADWSLLAEYTEEMDEWTEVVLSLPNPSSTYRVAFLATSEWARGMDIDDVTISGSLSTPSLDAGSFRAYPNPVSNVLTLEYSDAISKVEVYNMLGQLVASRNVDANQAQIDMDSLNAGTYMVKVQSGQEVSTVKVVKR